MNSTANALAYTELFYAMSVYTGEGDVNGNLSVVCGIRTRDLLDESLYKKLTYRFLLVVMLSSLRVSSLLGTMLTGYVHFPNFPLFEEVRIVSSTR